MRSEEHTGIAQKVFFFLCVIRNLILTMKCHFTTGKCPHIFNLGKVLIYLLSFNNLSKLQA
jgi:hypothetical protein